MSEDRTVVGFNDEEEKKILTVEIDCVTPPDTVQLEKIKEFINENYEADEIEFVIKRDPGVIGGFKIFVGDDNYDWSALGRIRQLRKSFQSMRKIEDRDRIISLLREDISNFELNTGKQQVGFVTSVSGNIAVISGLTDVEYEEIVLFECGIKGMVQDILSDG